MLQVTDGNTVLPRQGFQLHPWSNNRAFRYVILFSGWFSKDLTEIKKKLGPYGTALVLLEITDGQQQPLTTQGPFVRVYDNATIFDRHTAIATKLGFKTCWEAAGAIDRIPKPT